MTTMIMNNGWHIDPLNQPSCKLAPLRLLGVCSLIVLLAVSGCTQNKKETSTVPNVIKLWAGINLTASSAPFSGKAAKTSADPIAKTWSKDCQPIGMFCPAFICTKDGAKSVIWVCAYRANDKIFSVCCSASGVVSSAVIDSPPRAWLVAPTMDIEATSAFDVDDPFTCVVASRFNGSSPVAIRSFWQWVPGSPDVTPVRNCSGYGRQFKLLTSVQASDRESSQKPIWLSNGTKTLEVNPNVSMGLAVCGKSPAPTMERGAVWGYGRAR